MIKRKISFSRGVSDSYAALAATISRLAA
ncbi:hypothetical protein D046_0326A, partial [Vibrio parahaemolyticus V-223/04]